MSDWEKELNPEEREAWNAYVEHFREETVRQMVDSAMVMQIVPDTERIDVKFCTELGAAIMLDKPIIAIVMPGIEVPKKLQLIADEIVQADVDTSWGQQQIHAALDRMVARVRDP